MGLDSGWNWLPVAECWLPGSLESWRRYRRMETQPKAPSKDLLWLSSVALLVLCAVMLMNDRSKLDVAYLACKALQFASAIALIMTAGMAWHYAEKQQRLKLLACLLGDVDSSREHGAFLPSSHQYRPYSLSALRQRLFRQLNSKTILVRGFWCELKIVLKGKR